MYTILIADDEQIERKYLRNIFEKHPRKYQIVGEAADGKEVVRLAWKTKPDVIIMDISMPVLSGLEASLTIKEKLPDTIILLNTAYAEFEFARKAVEYRLDAYLLKPSSEELIFQTIDHCIRARQEHGGESKQPVVESAVPSMDTVAAYIDKHFKENISLNNLADVAHFSPSYLSHLFHQERGITIKGYLNQKRVAHAVYLLQSSRLSVKEISEQCGFTNISHFNRVFKQYAGKSPAEIRK